METGARKDLRSVQNIGIISTKFLHFGYLNICLLELLEKNFCRSSLILDLNQWSFWITKPWMCEKSKKLTKTRIE